jgi:hypothetical protein
MTEKRGSSSYPLSLNGFKRAGLTDMKMNKSKWISCPCRDYKNCVSWDIIGHIKGHLIQRGFTDGYRCWTKHCEEPAMPAESQGSCERVDLLGFGADNKKFMSYATPIAQGPIY